MQELKPIKEGKVREIYDNGDSLIMVATDRISCFDVILNNVVTKKGTVLTQMSKFWFDMTEGHSSEPHDFRRCQGYAGIFPAGEIRRQQHDVPETENASDGVYRPWLHHRKRLGKLQGERNRLRHHACRKA